MDIPLEIADHFVGDYVYAWLLPAASASRDSPHDLHNGTRQILSNWEYQPSTYLLYLEPSQAAYEGVWPRNNIYRQSISLFLLTWYASRLATRLTDRL